MPPRTAQPSIAQGHENANGNHAGVAGILLVAGLVDKGAQAGVGALVDKVDEVVGDGVQARGQGLVLDGAIELEARLGLLPDDGVAGLDVEVDEEEGGDGRDVGGGGARGQGNGQRGLSVTRGSHGSEV